MSPERLGGKPYSFPADVWAAGCVIFCLISHRFDDRSPFSPQVDDDVSLPLEEVFSAILESRLSLDHLPPRARSLLQRLLATVPGERLTAADALQHEWLADQRAAAPTRSRGGSAMRLRPRPPAFGAGGAAPGRRAAGPSP